MDWKILQARETSEEEVEDYLAEFKEGAMDEVLQVELIDDEVQWDEESPNQSVHKGLLPHTVRKMVYLKGFSQGGGISTMTQVQSEADAHYCRTGNSLLCCRTDSDILMGNGYARPVEGISVAALYAGFSDTVLLKTKHRQCTSGLQEVADVAAAIKAGPYDIGIVAGLQFKTVNKVSLVEQMNPKVELFSQAHGCFFQMVSHMRILHTALALHDCNQIKLILSHTLVNPKRVWLSILLLMLVIVVNIDS
jgi:hypothetical protein